MKSSRNSTNSPKYSIVIPAYNEEKYIKKTIKSLQDQNYTGTIEIIVVDNASTDRTASIAKNLGVIVCNEAHPGVCWARQKGTKIAKGKYIISVDADTYYRKDWLTKIDGHFTKDPKLVGVAGPCVFMNAPFWGNIFTFSLFGLSSLGYRITGKTIYASATNIAFSKKAWPGYNTSINQGGDELDLLRNLQKVGHVKFDNKNPSYSSPRRLVRGLIYNFFVTFLVFYILEYNLSRIFKRPILGSYPKFRNNRIPKTLSYFQLIIIIGVLLIATLIYYRNHIKVLANNYMTLRIYKYTTKETNLDQDLDRKA